MRISHFIILSSSFVSGCRIAMDFVGEEQKGAALAVMSKIKEMCDNDAPFSTQRVYTDSKDWCSVVAQDVYFEGVKLFVDVDLFVEEIQKSRVLSGMDVAKYILSQIRCTHTKLQKLAYLCYAEYLCVASEPLFHDKIYAFQYGPVVDSIYRGCKKMTEPGQEISPEADTQSFENDYPSAMRSKILFSKDGVQKVSVIDAIVNMYGTYSAKDLVAVTHRHGSPWDMVYDGAIFYQEISDEVIRKYHDVERITE